MFRYQQMSSNTNLFTILTVVVFFTTISAQDSQSQGRLLTPEEGCGISKVGNTKIVGGTQAKPGAFPWIALIGYKTDDGKERFGCGGSLITSRHVLTAAYCVRPNGTYLVRLGEHDLTKSKGSEAQKIKVIRVDEHSNFNPVGEKKDGHNDIAVLTLEHDVEFNDRIRPICLPLTKDLQNRSFYGSNPFVAGWGKIRQFGKRSDVLMQVQLPIIDNARCKKLYERRFLNFATNQFDDMVLCAGNLAGGQGSCQGDSGGPLMLPILQNGEFRMYQIGIVAYSFGCAHPSAPDIFTRVSKFMDWIQDKIEQ